MVDFRKSLVLAAAVLSMGIAANAQQASCVGTTGAPPALRSIGLTELTGQIVITCTNIAAATTVNITDILSGPFNNASTVPVNVTSRPNEAFAVVSGNPTPYYGVLTSVPSGQAPGGSYNVVSFNGVSIPAGSSTIIIGGVRADVTPNFNFGSFPAINSTLSVSNGSLPLQGNTFQVGLVFDSFTANGSSSTIANGCSAAVITLGTGITTINVSETGTNPTAFKVRLPQSSASPDSETGPYQNNAGGVPVIPGTATPVQLANSGTEIVLSLSGLPSGSAYYVPTVINSTANGGGAGTTGTAVLVTNAAPGSGAGTTPVAGAPVPALGPGNFFLVSSSSANQTVTYEVVSTSPSISETFHIPVAPTGNFGANFGTVNVSIGPTGAAPSGSTPPAYVPLFVVGGKNLLTNSSLNPNQGSGVCQTSLLFTFMTNQAGFDTGLSIANTGVDPFGTSSITGTNQGPTCKLNFYGTNVQGGNLNPVTIAPAYLHPPFGGEDHGTISNLAPGFQGYMIAVCNFQYAHGYAFITDGFGGPGKGLSEGYVANVIGNSRPGTPSTAVNGLAGPESLDH